MADDMLTYSDLIKPDNAIEDAIRELESLGSKYETLTQQVKRAAAEISNTLKTASTVTDKGKAQIEKAVEDANTLYEAYKSLQYQRSTMGKTEEYFAQKQSEVAKATRETYQQANIARDSYKGLNAQLRELINWYQSLSKAERDSDVVGKALAENILRLEKELKGISDTINLTRSTIDKSGTSYDDMRARLNALIAEYKQLDSVGRALSGSPMLAEIKTLATELREVDKLLKEAQAAPTPTAAAAPGTPGASYIGSVEQMQAKVKELTILYNQLGEAERKDPAIGGLAAEQIANYNQKIAEASKALKAQKVAVDKLAEAEQRWLNIKASIDATDKNKLSTTDAYATQKGQLEAYNRAIAEQIRLKKLEQQAALAEDGSYRQMSYTYEALIIKIKNMSSATAEAKKQKAELTQQARLLKAELQKEEEALGDYRSSVGNYNKVWNGLQVSMNMLIRELPAAAVSLNTFFLGISNNVPMLVDQIVKARQKNKDLIASGKSAVPVIKQLVGAIFSWHTALIIVLTVLSMYGEEISEWVVSLFKGEKQAMSFSDAMHAVADELQNTIKESGKAIVTFKNLQWEWKQLKSVAEKTQWLKDNKEQFKQLDINVRNINDAEDIFVKNSANVLKALMLRAKAAAAGNLAIKAYGEALEKQTQAETRENYPTTWDKIVGWGKTLGRVPQGMTREEWRNRVTRQLAANKASEFRREGTRLETEAEQFNKIQQSLLEEASGLAEGYHKEDRTRNRAPRDPENSIYKRYLEIQKKYEASITALERDEIAKRIQQTQDEAAAKIRALENTYRENEKILAGKDSRYLKLTPEQKKMVEQMQTWINNTIENYREKLNFDLGQLDKDAALKNLETERESINLKLASIKEGSEEEYKLRLNLLNNQRDAELIENSKLYEAERQDEIDIIMKYNKQIEELERNHRLKMLNAQKDNYQTQLSLVRENSDEELVIKLAQLDIEEQIALEQNKLLAKGLQQDEALIKASFTRQRNLLKGTSAMNQFDLRQQADKAEFDAKEHSEMAITRFTLKQEKARWEEQIKLAKAGALDWGEEQMRIALAELDRIDRELRDASFFGQIGEQGLGGALLSAIGFNDKQIKALEEATDIIIENIQAIVDAEVEAAETAVKLAEDRVDAAQRALDAEIEARNNGYANNVATAKKELEQEKRNQAEKQKILEAAQRRQEAINTVTQISSLVTASANLWSAFSGMGPVGPILALAAIAAMWASFAAVKIKAKQVAGAGTETYGEGGIEFLEGGSHASGNDIDLHTKNKRKKNMRAEGGEALAIINKRQTRKYKKVLPDIISHLNKGTFEDKYLNAFAASDKLTLATASNQSSNVDLSRLEGEVSRIRKQNESKYYVLPNGDIVLIHKNVKRIIKK